MTLRQDRKGAVENKKIRETKSIDCKDRRGDPTGVAHGCPFDYIDTIFFTMTYQQDCVCKHGTLLTHPSHMQLVIMDLSPVSLSSWRSPPSKIHLLSWIL
jgi:hypothetical protein